MEWLWVLSEILKTKHFGKTVFLLGFRCRRYILGSRSGQKLFELPRQAKIGQRNVRD